MQFHKYLLHKMCVIMQNWNIPRLGGDDDKQKATSFIMQIHVYSGSRVSCLEYTTMTMIITLTT